MEFKYQIIDGFIYLDKFVKIDSNKFYSKIKSQIGEELIYKNTVYVLTGVLNSEECITLVYKITNTEEN